MRIYEESYLLSHEKHQAYRLSSIQLGCSATLFSYCARMKIISDAKCQFIKNPQWPTRKRGLRLLRQLKCLAALKKLQQVSQLYQYDALNLLSYMKIDVKNIHSVGYHKDKLFTVLDYPMYPVIERARILWAILAIQPLPPAPIAPQNIQKMRDWA